MKRLAALTLSLTLLLGLAIPASGEEGTVPPNDSDYEEETVLPDAEEKEEIHSFPDIEGHWAQDIIEKWHSFGVIAGDTATGTFRPDDFLSRAEFATLLNRIMGYPLVEIKHFSDVPADTWYAETMSRLNSAGIIQGDGNNMVRPKDPVTRQEAAVILCRALGIQEQTANISFQDAEEIAPWAEGAVGALYNIGAVHGWEGYFDPQDPISRCQAVTLLNNLIGAVMTIPGTWDQDVTGDLYICAKRAQLENMTVTGDLILTPGVATGDVSLSGVKVEGDLIIRGGGEKSIHIRSGCELEGEVILAKISEGTLRLVNESETAIPSVRVSDGNPTVILEGNMDSVSVACGVPVILRNGSVGALSVSAPKADLTVEKDCSVSTLSIETNAKDAGLSLAGTVNTLTSHAAATVTNSGKIDAAHAAASGLVLAGTLPEKITMLSGILRPKNGNGKTITNITVVDK